MMKETLEILNPSGHLSLEWNPDDPDDRNRAREEVARLKAAGYSFFHVSGEPADEVAAGNDAGKLQVRAVEGTEEVASTPPGGEAEHVQGKSGGRTVAVPRLAGG